MVSADNTSGPALQRKERFSPTPYVPPSKKVYEILFQQLFDEYFNPPPRDVSLVLTAVAAPRAVDPVDSPSSTTINQDVPSASSSPTTQEIQSQVTQQGAEEQIHRHQNAQFKNAPLLHNLSSDSSSEETSIQGFIPSNLHHLNQSFNSITKLTLNHPLENVICDPSRSILTRSQLQGHAIWCYFDANDNPIPLVGNGVVEIYYLKGRITVLITKLVIKGVEFVVKRGTHRLYTSSLLNTACKKALNLLKKGFLIRVGRLWKLLKKEEACLTTKFNYFPKVQVKDLVLL
nr:hypothetical protein [Tanacetum cinerariifolium]